MMPTASEYYAEPFWSTPFGGGHRGFDIARGPGSGNVPMVRPGVVVRRSSNKHLGNFVVVKVAENDYDGYGHVIGGSGNDIGRPATWGENHGSKWSGPHVHLTNSYSVYGIDNSAVTMRNPLPIIIDSQYKQASSGSALVLPVSERKATMLFGYSVDSGGTLWTFIWPESGKYFQTRDQEEANRFGRLTGALHAPHWRNSDHADAFNLGERLFGGKLTSI